MKFHAFLLVAVLLAGASCNNTPKPAGDGPQVDQERQVPTAGATGLDISVPLRLHIRIDAEPSCRLKGPSNILSRMKTEMDGNILRISGDDKNHWSSNETAEAWVTIPHLQSLHTTGAGEIVIDNPVEEPAVSINLSGATNLDVTAIRTPKLELELGGTGNVVIHAGEVENARLSIAGTGNIEAFELRTQSADVTVSGAGRAALTALTRLNASISGTGMIRYRGNPQIEKRVSGIGTLQNAN